MKKQHNAIYDHSMQLVWPAKTLGRGNMCSNEINIEELATQGSEGEHSRKTICNVQSGEEGQIGWVGRWVAVQGADAFPGPLCVLLLSLLASMEYFQTKFSLFT